MAELLAAAAFLVLSTSPAAAFSPSTLISGGASRVAVSRLDYARVPRLHPCVYRTRLPRTFGVTTLRSKAEARAFRVGDAVEAMWIGDDGWYPGTIEGYLSGNQYDVKWADPQGLADTQVTPADNVRVFNPAVYYRFGLNALKQDDLQSAYLAFRCLLVVQGGFADAETYVKQLLESDEIKAFAQSRGDGDIATLTTKRQYPSAQKTEGDDGASKEDKKALLYTDEELEDLRQEAAEDQVKRDMWRQHNQFVAQHSGIWHGLWTEFEVASDELVPVADRRRTVALQVGTDAGGSPQFVKTSTAEGGAVEEAWTGHFYPQAESAWFVGNACTFAHVDPTPAAGGGPVLTLEVGLRHGDYRACCRFAYRRQPDGVWQLGRVGLGRELLGRYPAGDEALLFGGRRGELTGGVVLSGPADRVSTGLLRAQSDGLVSVGVEGGLSLSGPRSLPEVEDEVRNKEIVLEWSTPSVPGIGWDGKERIIPALHYRCARVFKQPSTGLEMLTLMETVPE